MRRHRIAVVGLPFFGRRVAHALREAGFAAQYLPHPGRKARLWPRTVRALVRADLVYTIGSSARRGGPADLMARARRKIVMHWAGTDVLHALNDWRAGRVSETLLARAEHWAAAPWLVDELKPMGVRAEAHPLPMVIRTGDDLPLPEDFRVLVYLATMPHSAYDIDGTMEVVRALPEIPFVLVGGYQPRDVPPNLEVVGWVEDMKAQYARTSALLRLVHHDAMSHSVIEALGYGRNVLWNYGIPGVQPVSGVDDAVARLRQLAAQYDRGALNETGMETARAYRPERIIPEATERFRGLLA